MKDINSVLFIIFIILLTYSINLKIKIPNNIETFRTVIKKINQSNTSFVNLYDQKGNIINVTPFSFLRR